MKVRRRNDGWAKKKGNEDTRMGNEMRKEEERKAE